MSKKAVVSTSWWQAFGWQPYEQAHSYLTESSSITDMFGTALMASCFGVQVSVL